MYLLLFFCTSNSQYQYVVVSMCMYMYMYLDMHFFQRTSRSGDHQYSARLNYLQSEVDDLKDHLQFTRFGPWNLLQSSWKYMCIVISAKRFLPISVLAVQAQLTQRAVALAARSTGSTQGHSRSAKVISTQTVASWRSDWKTLNENSVKHSGYFTWRWLYTLTSHNHMSSWYNHNFI